jgi:copper(I)-binding protein
MQRTTQRFLSVLGLSLALAGGAAAHETRAGDIRILHPYAVPSLQGVPNGTAYADLADQGQAGDRLVGASTPAAARVEFHTMKTEDGVMRMRAQPAIDIPAGQTLRMADSGLHFMLLGLKAPLKEGDKLPLTLEFAKAGTVTVEVWVQPRAQGSQAMEAHHHKH